MTLSFPLSKLPVHPPGCEGRALIYIYGEAGTPFDLEFPDISTVPRVGTDNVNKGASTLSYDPVFHKRTKHIRRGHHFVQECAQEGDITVHWVPGDENPVDMLTKSVA